MLLDVEVSTGRDIPLSFCPGTKKFICPGVPLSRDKMNFYLSNCTKKNSVKMNKFPVLERHFPVLEHPFLF